MKSYTLYSIVLLALAPSLISCEQEVKIELPKAEPKLVLTSFISPQDTVIVAQVTKSIPIFESRHYNKGNSNVEDAIVTISSGSRSATLFFNEGLGKYIADADDFPIIEGETYNLKATTPDGKSAEGLCTVPSANSSISFTYENLGPDDWGNVKYRVVMNWSSAPQDNYAYRIFGEVELEMDNLDPVYYSYSHIYIAEDFVRNEKNNYSRNGEFYYYDYNYISQKIRIFLINTDEHYYRYHISLKTYSDGNPFAEPAPLYTNITGGLGVFCAFNQTAVEGEFL